MIEEIQNRRRKEEPIFVVHVDYWNVTYYVGSVFFESLN